MEINTKHSFTEYQVTNPTSNFALGFDDFIAVDAAEIEYTKDGIHVTLNGVDVSTLGYTVRRKSPSIIEVLPSIESGVLRIYRETNIDKPFHQFTAGVLFEARTVDENFTQLRHSQQEVRDGLSYVEGRVLPLVNGLEEALAKADEASLAAQEASKAAQEAAQTTRSASNVNDANGLTQQQVNDGFNVPADLNLVPTPKNGSRVFVKSLQKWYTYNAALSAIDNGVTVIGKWEMDLQEAYYASWFAIKEVATDQSLKLQTGHDYATMKDRPFIADGVFYVEANQNYLGIPNNAFIVRDNSKITFLPNADFIQINQNKNQSNIILLMRTKNATLIRPKTTGDRLANTAVPHNSDAQGFGYGMTLYEPENCFIFEPNCSQNNGDNIYIGKPWGSNQDILPKNITIVRPICHHTRRNCISLTAWDNVKIIDPILSYAGDSDGIVGAFPKSCIDVELENAPTYPSANGYRGVITNPKCLNSGNGLFFYSGYDDRSFDIHIQGDLILDGISAVGLGLFHGSRNNIGLVKIDNVRYLSSTYQEITLAWHKDSKLKVEIDNVYPFEGDGNFEIASLINGDFLTKTLGNVTINNIHTLGFTPFLTDIGADYIVDGYRFHVAKDSKFGVTPFTNNSTIRAKISGADTYIESKDSYTHTGFSASTTLMPNEIWQVPPDPITAVYLNTKDDLRMLKIGLKYDGIVGNGCNIGGINILVDGVAKTQARTATLGGWIKFQNISGGRTRIFDQYGVWAFS